MSEPTKQFIVCLDRTVDHLDTTYGPFDTIDEAEAWLVKRGFQDDAHQWTHRILELQPDLDQDFINSLAADKKANTEYLQRQADLAAKMQRLKDLQS